MHGDHRWLAHDKTANALTTRYLAALAPDWYKVQHADISQFRRANGLEPTCPMWPQRVQEKKDE